MPKGSRPAPISSPNGQAVQSAGMQQHEERQSQEEAGQTDEEQRNEGQEKARRRRDPCLPFIPLLRSDPVRRSGRTLKTPRRGLPRSGGHSARETPGPIPNPAVKPRRADGTASQDVGE